MQGGGGTTKGIWRLKWGFGERVGENVWGEEVGGWVGVVEGGDLSQVGGGIDTSLCWLFEDDDDMEEEKMEFGPNDETWRNYWL